MTDEDIAQDRDKYDAWSDMWRLERYELYKQASTDCGLAHDYGFKNAKVVCRYVSIVDKNDENYFEIYAVEQDGDDTYVLLDWVTDDPIPVLSIY